MCAHSAISARKKSEAHCVHLTFRGNLIGYPGSIRTPSADLTTIKLHLYKVISNPTSWYMYMDVKDSYLNMPMDCYEYICIPVKPPANEFMAT